MRIELDSNSLGTGPNGDEVPTQVYIEIYEGKLRIHIWDGSTEDPVTTVIEPLTQSHIHEPAKPSIQPVNLPAILLDGKTDRDRQLNLPRRKV